MERRTGIDEPNEEAMAAFAGRASEGPVYMLNLLEFRPDGIQEPGSWAARRSSPGIPPSR